MATKTAEQSGYSELDFDDVEMLLLERAIDALADVRLALKNRRQQRQTTDLLCEALQMDLNDRLMSEGNYEGRRLIAKVREEEKKVLGPIADAFCLQRDIPLLSTRDLIKRKTKKAA